MPNVIVPNEAKINWADAVTANKPSLRDAHLRLFKSPVIVDRETTLAELEAAQATYPGYGALELDNWSNPVIVNSAAITEADPVTFRASAPSSGLLYGAYATNGAGDRLWFVASFTDPVPIPFDAELQVTLEVRLDSIFNE